MNMTYIMLMLIASVESNNGRDLKHPAIRNPASIHYGEAAQGRFAIMPATLREFRTTDPEKAARLMVDRISAKTACPFEALILWEMGPRHHITAKDWKAPHTRQRLKRAQKELIARRIAISEYMGIMDVCAVNWGRIVEGIK